MFDHDWFASPFIMMTCQVMGSLLIIFRKILAFFSFFSCQPNGEFDAPDWDGLQCVYRKNM